jgi:tRNA pseudouridine38-40 synthase
VKTKRYKVICSYDGTDFFGWARQPRFPTIQQHVERALEIISRNRRGSTSVKTIVGGRTDTGVHALGQVFHVDLDDAQVEKVIGKTFADLPSALIYRANSLLPKTIRLLSCSAVPREFNARYSAIERHYVYRIFDSTCQQTALNSRYAHFIDGKIDLETINFLGQKILGLHDFSAFIKSRPHSTNIRELKEFRFVRLSRSKGICAHLRADAFAHNMVRSLIRSALLVGLGKKTPAWFLDRFNSRVRVGETGPIEAKGLILRNISYPQSKTQIIAQNALSQQTRPSENN